MSCVGLYLIFYMIQVVQYQGSKQPFEESEGDTSMMVIPPIEQYFNQMCFSVGESIYDYRKIYLVIVAPAGQCD